MKPISYSSDSEWALINIRDVGTTLPQASLRGSEVIFHALPSSWGHAELICLEQALKAQQGGMKILQGLNYLLLFSEDMVWFPFHLIRVLLDRSLCCIPPLPFCKTINLVMGLIVTFPLLWSSWQQVWACFFGSPSPGSCAQIPSFSDAGQQAVFLWNIWTWPSVASPLVT